MKKQYKDLYAMGIITLMTLILMPVIIWWWNFTLTAPFEAVNNEVKTETVQEVNDNEKLNQNDIFEMNKNTFYVPVKSMELVEKNESYYFLYNNDGSMYIADNQELRHNENYVLEVDKFTDEIVEIRFDLKFEFDTDEENLFTEWFDNDIEIGKQMLNEYLGIENYTEISI